MIIMIIRITILVLFILIRMFIKAINSDKFRMFSSTYLQRYREEMDGSKKVGSSSSITAELFGPKESPPSSSASLFASMFPPPPGVVTGTQALHNKQGIPDTRKGAAYENSPIKYGSSIFHGDRAEPCHLSSSLYYGGQDIYSQSSSSKNDGSYQNFKDGGEDYPSGNNSDAASRGNWWQGSLYY